MNFYKLPLIILSLYFQSAIGQVNICRLDKLPFPIERIDLTKIKQFGDALYAPFAYRDSNGTTKWRIEKIDNNDITSLTDTNYNYILDYKILDENSVSVLGKTNSSNGGNQIISISNNQTSEIIIPHYYVFDSKGYIAVTDTLKNKTYIDAIRDHVSVYNSDISTPVNNQFVKKLYPINESSLAKMEDTSSRFHLLHFDSELKKMIVDNRYQSLTKLEENKNGTFYIENNNQKLFIYKSSIDNNIKQSSIFDSLINFEGNNSFAFGRKVDNTWWSIDANLNEYKLPVYNAATIESINYFKNSNSSFVISYKDGATNNVENGSFIIQIYTQGENNLPNLIGTITLMRATPICALGIRYYFAEERNGKLHFSYYKATEDTLVKLKSPSLPTTVSSITVQNIQSDDNSSDFLLNNSSTMYQLSFSRTEPQKVYLSMLLDSLNNSFTNTNKYILAVKIPSKENKKDQIRYIWRAVDILKSFENKKAEWVDTSEYTNLYQFINITDISKNCCAKGFYYSGIKSGDKNEKIEMYKTGQCNSNQITIKRKFASKK